MTTPTAELPIHIDSTMMSCFRQCPEKFRLEFALGLRPARMSIDLHAGACFATGVETVRRTFYIDGKTLSEAIATGYAAFMDAWGDFVAPDSSPKQRDRVWEAVETYFTTWFPPATDHVQPYGKAGSFEFTFAIPLEPAGAEGASAPTDLFPLHPSGAPFVYSGRFDMLGFHNGAPKPVDEKTTKSIGADWASQWDLRSQFIGYVWACRQSGIPVEDVVVRGIGILKTKLTPAEVIKTFPEALQARWFEQLRRDLWRLRRAWDEGYFDINLADACSAYGGCPFRDICRSANPENWYSNYIVHRWNPLLKNPISEEAA